MTTSKKRSTTTRKKQGRKRTATKKRTRVRTGPKKAAAKKARARKKAAAPKKAAPRTRVARRKTAPTARKPRAARSAAAHEVINPQRQLDKLSAAASAPSVARSMPMSAGMRALEAPTMPEGFFDAYTGAPLSEQDFADAAQTLGCEVAAVKAVAEVESAGAGFDANHRPTILYERHVFARNTQPAGKFNQTNPDVSSSKPYAPGTYGSKDQQFAKLARAFQLDQEAALKAPSWGKFQILGENYKACGFTTVAAYVRAMTISEGEHLKGFVRFLLSSPKRLEAIRAKDWTAFARHYNGPNFAQFKYDKKLAAAYAKHAHS